MSIFWKFVLKLSIILTSENIFTIFSDWDCVSLELRPPWDTLNFFYKQKKKNTWQKQKPYPGTIVNSRYFGAESILTTPQLHTIHSHGSHGVSIPTLPTLYTPHNIGYRSQSSPSRDSREFFTTKAHINNHHALLVLQNFYNFLTINFQLRRPGDSGIKTTIYLLSCLSKY